MKTYKIKYCDDDSAVLKDFLCEATTCADAVKQLIETIPEVYYYSFCEV